MKRLIIAAIAIVLCMPLFSRKETLIREWQFSQMQSEEEATDTSWHNVVIPHDWAISKEFDRKYDLQEVAIAQNGEAAATWKTGRSGGLPWMGKGHYRTRIAVDSTKWNTLIFDGAMSHAHVYANGEEIGYQPYGYNSFECHIPQQVIKGDYVEIDVYLENKPQQSRWYPGAGLYRNVHLVTTEKIHIPTWGVCVRTPEVSKEQATIEINIELNNGNEPTNAEAEDIEVETDIIIYGVTVGKIKGLQGKTTITQPELWSPETPDLYTAHTYIKHDEHVIDETETRFGIRSIKYIPEKGFQLNGKTRKFKGVCNHHDLGPLGAAIHKDALRHQIRLLQDMGCNAIRTSHNMPAPELVELCDELGMMMMIEPFDTWNQPKTANDYNVEFTEWWQADITNMVKQYRNNASVMMWSSGNEIWNQVLADGPELVNRIQALFHQLDPTRPVTNGMDQVKQSINNGFAAAVELPGFNYKTHVYKEGYKKLPQKIILGSETASTVSSRGVYKRPVVIRDFARYDDKQSSGYDVEYCPWSGLPEWDFELEDDNKWHIGQFVWTGFDYLGEPCPYETDAWPSHSSYFGIIDLASIPKDRFWLYRSKWNKIDPTLHILPHWNWKKGENIPVFCYTSYPSAELFVNGKSYGRLRHATKEETERLAKGEQIEGVSPMITAEVDIKDEWHTPPRPELLPRYRLMWMDVPYEKGEIEVVAYNEKGKEAARTSIKTAGKPYQIVTEWANEHESPEELCYITIKVVDKEGTLCPHAGNLIQYNGTGFVATANGDATCTDNLTKPQMHAFTGQCTFIVKKGARGVFSSKGLKSAQIEL